MLHETDGGIRTQHLYFPHIDTTPYEHIIGYGDNLVTDLVIIAVQCQLQEIVAIGGTDIHLMGTLRFQVRTAIVVVIVLIERRCPEDVLIRDTHIPVSILQQLIG